MEANKLKSTLFICGIFFICFYTNPNAQIFNGSSYFPLGLNYNWNFNNGHFPLKETITDTITLNNRIYYGVSLFQANYVAYWYREENNKIYLYNKDSSFEFLLHDFSADTGTCWELPKGYECTFGTKVLLASKTDTVATPLGTFYNCYRFNHTPNCMDAGLFSAWFAKDIGKVRFLDNNISGTLDNKLESYSVVTNINNTHADNFYLQQNYPNPFNAVTKIIFSLNRSENISLIIYDSAGRIVKKLIDNEFKNTGQYSLIFNAGDLPSGIYFYSLVTDEKTLAKKAVLLK